MSEVTALIVHIIQVKNNFVHLSSKLLGKYRNSKNVLGCIEIKANQRRNYGSCSATPNNSNGENAFNISAAFAQTLRVNEYDTVIVSNANFVSSLKTVRVTPTSVDNLEILESSAETVQSTLLNQIRVVRVHHTLSVWISKSFTLKIHIDYLDDGVVCGKLEEYTEVVVSPEVKVCVNCNTTEIEDYTTDVSVPGPWNFLKDIFSFISTADNASTESVENSNEVTFISSGVLRCLVFDGTIFNPRHLLRDYPYNAFITRKYCSRVSAYARGTGYFLCRLTHIPYISSKALKGRQVRKEDAHPVTGLSSQEIYVHLHVIEDSDVLDNVTYSLINCYPSIFISKAVRYFFNLKTNSKVKLDFIEDEKTQRLTEIDFTFVRKPSSSEENIANVKHYLQSCAQSSPNVIVNNHCLFTSDNSDLLYVTFNPASVPFVELSKEDIDRCNFRLIQRKINVNVEDDDRDAAEESDSNIVPLSFQQNLVQKMKKHLLLKLRLLRTPHNSDLENSNHTVVEGDIGTGKSSIINTLCRDLSKSPYGIFIKKLECKTLKGKLVSKLEKVLEEALNECAHFQPAILCLDDLDMLFTPSKQSTQQQSEPSVSSYSNRLSNVIRDLVQSYSSYHVTVLATASSISNFEPCLFQARGSSLFSSSLRIPALSQEIRHEVFLQFLSNKANLEASDVIQNREYVSDVVQRIENYCVQDISDLVDRIYFEVLKRRVNESRKLDTLVVSKEDVDKAVSATVPLSLIGIDLRKDTTVSWKDVGGLTTAKQLLTEILIWPSRFPNIFEQCPLKMQSGVLLYGVPGSGKTLLASAVAGESGLNFISIKGPELLSKFVGESEEGIRNTFRKAQNAKPCILFFDEFDSLAPRRGNDITGVTDRVVNQLLTELDGVESVSGVWVLAATSRPDLIDPALLRPGRLGTMIHCPLPNQIERCSILNVISSSAELTDDVDFDAVAKITEGYTGADLRAVLYTAVVSIDRTRQSIVKSHLRLQDELTESLGELQKISEKVDTECLIAAAQKTRPSLKLEERLVYDRIYKRFQQTDEKFELPLDKQRLTYA